MIRLGSFYEKIIVGLSLLVAACHKPQAKRFDLLPSSQTGVTFANTLTQTDQLNAFTFTNFYNGGGVGVGDVNNDGKPDVFFGGNQVSCRLYLNQIDSTNHSWKFDDITESAGVSTNRWCTGVSMVDLNGDGWLDIYVSAAKHPGLTESKNLLFINQGLKKGKPVFKEMAAEYGLADDAYTTQTAFFDYDLDGDLDAYLLNTAPDLQNPNILRQTYNDGTYPSTGKLYRNEGNGPKGHPTFTDISKQAGIVYEGLGLGLAISDLNKDGYPDIYCSNDFISSDILYLNNGKRSTNGPAFTNVIRQATAHTSLYGMGVDVADFNNDGLPDVFQLDMLPEENARQKKMLAGQDYDRKELSIAEPYRYQMQYMRNSLQLNLGAEGMGLGARGKAVDQSPHPIPSAPTPLPSAPIPRFSEIGLLAGVAKTDWSWSALFGDYDNDGRKDLFITNGYRRDVTDRDFIQFTEEFSGFGTTEFQKDKREELMKKVPEVQVPNYAYRNTGDVSFTDVSQEWGLASLSYSNGAAYADLDNDGDLDLVVNTLDSEALIYQNTTQEQSPNHYVSIQFDGAQGNRQGIGVKATVWAGGQMQYAELSVVRGFQSSVEPVLHFGLGKSKQIDSLRVEWPGGKTETRYRVQANQRLHFRPQNAHDTYVTPTSKTTQPLFANVPLPVTPTFQHQSSDFVDFKQTAALHKMLSRSGFALATGDINGDGLEDCFVGGTYRGSKACFLVRTAQGGFTQKSLPVHTDHDDTAALLFDADGDKDLDLYVVSGGYQQSASDKAFYQDQLYINNSRGDFSPASSSTLPDVSGSGSCVVATDFDHDGDLDLFVGGRLIPGKYPLPARSYLLRNDQSNGVAKFTDVTAQVCPWLLKAGLVCSALWTDTDHDGWADLILAGEWMPITVLKGGEGKGQGAKGFTLRPMPLAPTPLPTGWWNSLAQGDFDNDGDLDYIAGNEGLNTLYRASEQEPLKIVAKDFNNDGTFDPLMGYFIKGVAYPAVPRDALNQQVIQFRRKYQHYADYAQVTFANLLSDDELKDAYHAQATYLQSAYIENLGNGQFRITPLPRLAQESPIYGIVPYDFNKDGNLDVVLTGNFFPNEVNMGRQDASVGLVLLGNGHGQFRALPSRESGLFVTGDARTSVLLSDKSAGKVLVTAVNGQGLAVNRYIKPKGH
ncbi:VCBS repeat-containing protein [Spirosoma validum]|uniref:VCBS repeat-containing protein n=1 Tax=Spirosoma validum TaxID=2771355 RepID=A0A927GCB5_9BACT|nr:VCBS repeat-containing protein [Spirosoma validum]MBD2752350.1 VCBS repeat-containing protein [Spirosoma validum]